MSGLTKQKTQSIDVNAPVVRPLQGAQANWLQGIYGGQNPYASMVDPTQSAAAGAYQNALQNPTATLLANQQTNGALAGLMNAQAQTAGTYGGPQAVGQTAQLVGLPQAYGPQNFSVAQPGALNFAAPGTAQADLGGLARYTNELQLSPIGVQQVQAGYNPWSGQEVALNGPMAELRNPYGDLGAMNPALVQLAAQTPLFDRNLRAAQTQLANSAPGRFSTAFTAQGQDLASQALQDYNVFAAQALQQGQALQLQQQQAALNFALGARGISQDALTALNQAKIGARDVAQTGTLEGNAQNLQAQTTNAGNSLQAQIANAQNTLQARQLAQQAAQALSGLGIDAFNANTNAQSVFNQALLGQRGQDVQLAGLGLDAQTQAAQLGLSARAQDTQAMAAYNQALLANAGLANDFGLQSQGLAQQAWQQQQQAQLAYSQLAQSGALSAAGLIQQGGAAQDAAYGALLQNAGAFGLNATQGAINPLLQIQMAGLGWAQPQAQQVVVQPSVLQQAGALVGQAANAFGAYQTWKNGGAGIQPGQGGTQPMYR